MLIAIIAVFNFYPLQIVEEVDAILLVLETLDVSFELRPEFFVFVHVLSQTFCI